MNFLDLVKRTSLECSIAGTGPAAVTGQTGMNQNLVNWVATAYRDLQNRHTDWRWMRSTWSVNTTSGDDTYAGTDCTDTRLSATVTRFARWWPLDEQGYRNVKIYLQSAGVGTEGYLNFLPWAAFRELYRKGTQNNGFPAHCTIDPQNNLVVGPKPDGIYVVSGEYQMSAQELAADTDIPEMPSRFHLFVVWKAVQDYGWLKAAQEILGRGQKHEKTLLRQLEIDQRPALGLGSPIA